MFDYMTVQEAATKWGISERRIQKLCEENRILGVVRLSRGAGEQNVDGFHGSSFICGPPRRAEKCFCLK